MNTLLASDSRCVEQVLTGTTRRTAGQLALWEQSGWVVRLFDLPVQRGEVHFNPTVVVFRGEPLLITRTATNIGQVNETSKLCFWSIGNPMRLRRCFQVEGWQVEDPRAFVNRDELVVGWCRYRPGEWPTQYVSYFDAHLDLLRTERPLFGRQGSGPEKNWVWFSHNASSYFVYDPCPHVVACYTEGKVTGSWVSSWSGDQLWPYGIMRGGTPPVRHHDEYVTFYHSSMLWQGQRRRYVMGCYTFEAKPPFVVKKLTRCPLLWGSEAALGQPMSPLTVFASGALFVNDTWFVVFGINDYACGWVEIPHEDLQLALCPIP